jgi:putative solute:sodium symporter small subunit
MDKILYDLLPTSLTPVENANFTPELTEQIPEIMQLYLVHNRSVLTDARFLGFPFHYWYTAQFLLILFVGLCIIYASFIDRLHKKYNIEQ